MDQGMGMGPAGCWLLAEHVLRRPGGAVTHLRKQRSLKCWCFQKFGVPAKWAGVKCGARPRAPADEAIADC
eukprot:scaffold14602_cov118-Isochrysis_galbana.AAC.3